MAIQNNKRKTDIMTEKAASSSNHELYMDRIYSCTYYQWQTADNVHFYARRTQEKFHKPQLYGGRDL